MQRQTHHLAWTGVIVLASTLFQCGIMSLAQAQGTKSLVIDKKFISEEYTKQPKKNLDEALKQTLESPSNIKIDVKKALQDLDQAEPQKQATSLAHIRQRALENNLQLKAILIDPEIANTQVRMEEAKFDQTIFVYAKYGQKEQPNISGDNVSFKSNDVTLDKKTVKLTSLEQEKKTTEIESGIKIPLRTGGNLQLSLPVTRVDSKGLFDSNESRSAMRFSFSQPLLRNAGRKVNEASIVIAQNEQQATWAKSRLQALRVLATIDKAYWNLNEAWSILEVRQKQYQYATDNLAMVKQRVDEGLSAAIEINRADIGVADRLEALIVANTQRMLAQRQLAFYLNELDSNNYQDKPMYVSTLPDLTFFAFDREKLINTALEQRLDLLEQELKLSADLIKIDYLENQTLPLFTLDYQYGALSNTENSFRNSLNSVGDYNDWSIGLKFEMPISNEARKSALDMAVQIRLQRLTNQTLQKLTIKKEILDAVDQVEQHWQRIIAARQQVIIAGKNYDAELKQFNEGLRTMTEVLETLTRLGEAQVKEVRAINDYQIAQIDLAYATGTLLGYAQTEIKQ